VRFMGKRLRRIKEAGRRATQRVRDLASPRVRIKQFDAGKVDWDSGDLAMFIPPEMERGIESLEKLKDDINGVVDGKIERLVSKALSNGSTITSTQVDSIAIFLLVLRRMEEGYSLLAEARCTDAKILSRMGVLLGQVTKFFVENPKQPKGLVGIIRNSIYPELVKCLKAVGKELSPHEEAINRCREEIRTKLRNRRLEVGFGVK